VGFRIFLNRPFTSVQTALGIAEGNTWACLQFLVHYPVVWNLMYIRASWLGAKWCGNVGQPTQLARSSFLEGVKKSPNLVAFGSLQLSSISLFVTLSTISAAFAAAAAAVAAFLEALLANLEELSVICKWNYPDVSDSGNRTEGTMPLRMSPKKQETLLSMENSSRFRAF
jgi:hypothetical protein